MRPFRFGVNARTTGSRAEWVEKARKIEALGYAVLGVPDHLSNLVAPMPALASVAEATTKLRIGTMVLNNDFRHPVLVAREAATLDLLSDGRLELGLGAGPHEVRVRPSRLAFRSRCHEDILRSPYVRLGAVDQLVEDLEARRKRWGITYYTIFEPSLDAFAPVVARLAGE